MNRHQSTDDSTALRNGIVLVAAVVGIEELLEPEHELEVVLELALD